MPKVPNLNIPPPPPQRKRTVIICTRGKSLTAEDRAEIDKFIEFRRQRFLKSKHKRKSPKEKA